MILNVEGIPKRKKINGAYAELRNFSIFSTKPRFGFEFPFEFTDIRNLVAERLESLQKYFSRKDEWRLYNYVYNL